jgi:Cu+-exporting ATPase
MLRFAASLEQASEHPWAAAIMQGAQARGVQLTEGHDFASLTGKGVRGGGKVVAMRRRHQ